jgi:hypothetical protein
MSTDPIDGTSRVHDVSRRAAVLTLAVSGIVGFGVGWGVGVSRPAAAVTTDSQSPATTATDPGDEISNEEIEWARGVQSGSDERLAQEAESFLVLLTRCQSDEFIPGAARLTELLIADGERADAGYFERDRRRKLCSFLVDWIEAWPVAAALRPRLVELRRVR